MENPPEDFNSVPSASPPDCTGDTWAAADREADIAQTFQSAEEDSKSTEEHTESQHKVIQFRTGKSIALHLTFLGVGLASGLVGPTLVSMEKLLDTDTSTISGAFIGGGIGYVSGSLLCGAIFDHMNRELQFSLAVLLQGVSAIVAPFTDNVYAYIVMCSLAAVAMGFIDSGGNSYALILWGGQKIQGPFMHAIHTAWSLGGTLGPLIVTPFLVNFEDGIAMNSTNVSGLINASNLQFHESDTVAVDIGLVRYAYVTLGCLVLTSGIAFLVLFIAAGASCEITMKNKKDPEDQDKKEGSRWFRITMLCLLFIHFHIVVYVEGCTSDYIASFVVQYLGWENQKGAMVLSTFQGALGLGRLTNVAVAAVLSPRSMIIINLTFTLCSYILMCFVEYHNVIVWLSVAMAGFFQSSTFPTSVLWASGYIKVDGLAAGVFLCGAASAGLIFPFLVGNFFDTETEMKMIYMLLGLAVLQVTFFASMQLFAHFKSKASSPVDKDMRNAERDELNKDIWGNA